MKLKKQLTQKLIVPLIFLIVVIAALVAGIFLSQQRQELRQQASVGYGTASISLDPASAQLQTNQENFIDIKVNTVGTQIDGIQFKLTLEGNATAVLQPAEVSGLNVLTQKVEGNVITYAAVTSDPETPYSTDTSTKIATITLTPQEAINLVFDQAFSKIASHGSGEDILSIPTDGSYTVAQAAGDGDSSSTGNGSTSDGSGAGSASEDSGTSDTGGTTAVGGNCPLPSIPGNVKARAGQNSGEIIVSWLASTNVDHYAVSYGTASGNYQYGAADVGNIRGFTIGSLNPGQTYYIVIYAVNSCGSSPASFEVAAKAAGGRTSSTGGTTATSQSKGAPVIILPSPSPLTSPSTTPSALFSPRPSRPPLHFPSPSPTSVATPEKPKKGLPLAPFILILGIAGTAFFGFRFFKSKKQPNQPLDIPAKSSPIANKPSSPTPPKPPSPPSPPPPQVKPE